jgi:hypothetical protein
MEMILSPCLMKKSTLSKEQFLNLSRKQQEVVLNYYDLVRDSQPPPPDIDEVIRIWEIAETDSKICAWLEFIDFFVISPVDNPIFSEDTRSYLSERILVSAIQNHPQDAEMNGMLDTFNSLKQNYPEVRGCLRSSEESSTRSPTPQFWGTLIRKSPRIGRFRGRLGAHSRLLKHSLRSLITHSSRFDQRP